jgi:N6-L-threonylcarbamoyladenine synthase
MISASAVSRHPYSTSYTAQMRENPNFVVENLNDLCASIQKTIIDILLKKLEAAAIANGAREIALAGGVSANSELRKRFTELGAKHKWKTHIPKFDYCTPTMRV